jgi:hypothetical protein
MIKTSAEIAIILASNAKTTLAIVPNAWTPIYSKLEITKPYAFAKRQMSHTTKISTVLEVPQLVKNALRKMSTVIDAIISPTIVFAVYRVMS